MTKNYYRSEYSDKQWKALIDKATELGCQITYSKYGNIVTIDSTDRESRIIATTGRDGQDRAVWAERIHGMIQESTNLKAWKVQPKRYHKGYCPTICKSRRVAELEQERLERITGFEWGNKSNDGIIWTARELMCITWCCGRMTYAHWTSCSPTRSWSSYVSTAPGKIGRTRLK